MAEETWWGNGWNFAPPKDANNAYRWADSRFCGVFADLFTYTWVNRLLQNDAEQASQKPVLGREVRQNDGSWTFDLTLLDFMAPTSAAHWQLARDGYESLAATPALRVTLSGELRHRVQVSHIELFNPLAQCRQRLSPWAFKAFAEEVVARSLAVRLAQNPAVAAESGPTLAANRHAAKSLLLANLFAAKRVPFDAILRLSAALPYPSAHAVLSDLGEADTLQALDISRLAVLYG